MTRSSYLESLSALRKNAKIVAISSGSDCHEVRDAPKFWTLELRHPQNIFLDTALRSP
ncbi:hypothetical protein BRAS3809_6970001 [Bradyrhizobium sp. STM 3809]|nr:hypothetical protein BRAS3809_6970001 [Bradyrhizobium sp. STM 3809]